MKRELLIGLMILLILPSIVSADLCITNSTGDKTCYPDNIYIDDFDTSAQWIRDRYSYENMSWSSEEGGMLVGTGTTYGYTIYNITMDKPEGEWWGIEYIWLDGVGYWKKEGWQYSTDLSNWSPYERLAYERNTPVQAFNNSFVYLKINTNISDRYTKWHELRIKGNDENIFCLENSTGSSRCFSSFYEDVIYSTRFERTKRDAYYYPVNTSIGEDYSMCYYACNVHFTDPPCLIFYNETESQWAKGYFGWKFSILNADFYDVDVYQESKGLGGIKLDYSYDETTWYSGWEGDWSRPYGTIEMYNFRYPVYMIINRTDANCYVMKLYQFHVKTYNFPTVSYDHTEEPESPSTYAEGLQYNFTVEYNQTKKPTLYEVRAYLNDIASTVGENWYNNGDWQSNYTEVTTPYCAGYGMNQTACEELIETGVGKTVFYPAYFNPSDLIQNYSWNITPINTNYLNMSLGILRGNYYQWNYVWYNFSIYNYDTSNWDIMKDRFFCFDSYTGWTGVCWGQPMYPPCQVEEFNYDLNSSYLKDGNITLNLWIKSYNSEHANGCSWANEYKCEYADGRIVYFRPTWCDSGGIGWISYIVPESRVNFFDLAGGTYDYNFSLNLTEGMIDKGNYWITNITENTSYEVDPKGFHPELITLTLNELPNSNASQGWWSTSTASAIDSPQYPIETITMVTEGQAVNIPYIRDYRDGVGGVFNYTLCTEGTSNYSGGCITYFLDVTPANIQGPPHYALMLTPFIIILAVVLMWTRNIIGGDLTLRNIIIGIFVMVFGIILGSFIITKI